MISLQKLASELNLENLELIVAGGCKKKNKVKSVSSVSSVSSSSMLPIEIINT
jgi:hypothetical protein